MNRREIRQYEMLVRVHQFGEARPSAFPDASEGGQALAAVARAVSEITAYGDAKSQAMHGGREAKETSRQALVEKLRSISRTARVIARKEPGFADRFRMPTRSNPSDQAVLAAGPRVWPPAASYDPSLEPG